MEQSPKDFSPYIFNVNVHGDGTIVYDLNENYEKAAEILSHNNENAKNPGFAILYVERVIYTENLGVVVKAAGIEVRLQRPIRGKILRPGMRFCIQNDTNEVITSSNVTCFRVMEGEELISQKIHEMPPSIIPFIRREHFVRSRDRKLN